MSLDAFNMLDSLTLIGYHYTVSRLDRMEILNMGYSKKKSYMMGDSGRSMIQEVMICYN